MSDPANDGFKELAEHAPDARIAPAQGIAAIALSMAMKYHDISTVQDGQLYQQYKLEGRNLVPLQLGMVFETAILMERHLIAASDRIADLLIEALEVTEEPNARTQEAMRAAERGEVEPFDPNKDGE